VSAPIDLRAVRRIHKRFENAHRQMVNTALRDAGEFATNHVRSFSKFKRRSATGSLKDATRWRLLRRKNVATLVIKSTKKTASFIDLGTRPHIIRARRAKTLKFVWRGGLRFYKKVNHPGNRPFRFLWNATRAAYRIAEQQIQNRMEQVARRF
jgi:hypothetical protein